MQRISKARQKKCKKGLHHYDSELVEMVNTSKGKVMLKKSKCIYCGATLVKN